MMQDMSETFAFTMALRAKTHRLAEQFCRQQSTQKKAKQVYLNTLAVSAVDFYLSCMGFDTDWQASDSWNPVMQSLMDVADLKVKKLLKKIECRPVLPDTQVINIPPEVWSDRIGYVAVKLNESLTQATLLGFVKKAATEELPISSLRSLEEFLEHLSQIPVASDQKLVKLSQWFDNVFEAGWQSLETLLGTRNQQNLAFSLRSGCGLSEAGVKRSKLIDLGVQLKSQSVALLVAIAPETEQKVGVRVQLHPTGGESYLPPHLKLVMLSESGETLQEVESRSGDNYIQLRQIRGLPGEGFKIMVALDEVSITENFVI